MFMFLKIRYEKRRQAISVTGKISSFTGFLRSRLGNVKKRVPEREESHPMSCLAVTFTNLQVNSKNQGIIITGLSHRHFIKL